MIAFISAKLVKRSGDNYWIYVRELDSSLKEGNIITYDKYNGRELKVNSILLYDINNLGEYKEVEGVCTHRVECIEVNKIEGLDHPINDKYGMDKTLWFTVNKRED